MNEHADMVDQPRHRRSRPRAKFLIVLAAAVTLMLMAGSVIAWHSYLDWRVGRIELITNSVPLVAQVLAESSDDPIGEPFDLVTRAVISLPAGDYRLRVNGMGRLGRTYRFAVNRGETQSHTISLDEGRLLGGEPAELVEFQSRRKEVPRPFAPVTVALELTKGKADMIEWSRGSLIRRDSATGIDVWDALHRAKPFDGNRDPSPWIRDVWPNDGEDLLAKPAPDLDGDGTGDLLWSFRGLSAFLALSGKDGSMLWNYSVDLDNLDGPGGSRPDGPEPDTPEKPSRRSRYLLGTPALADLDRDGTKDLVATISFSETQQEAQQRSPGQKARVPGQGLPVMSRHIVVAISGRSGRWLWSYSVDKAFTNPSYPDSHRGAMVVQGQSLVVSIEKGEQWLGLDGATGRPKSGPFELGFVPIRPVQHADLDGDGEPEIVALGSNALAAFSATTGKELWVADIDHSYDQSENAGPHSDWPATVDLDGDGRAEIVVPDSGPMPPLSGYRGVRALDGVTGKTRWVRPMRPTTKADDGVIHVLVGPDLDGDGSRDLVTVSLFAFQNPPGPFQARAGEPERVYVDALSGKDGRPLWWWRVDLAERHTTAIWQPFWWSRGPDGWPLLALPLEPTFQGYLTAGPLILNPPIVHLLEASTGKEVDRVTGLTKARIADLDGDGLEDLWGEVEGEMCAVRGEAPEAWRALGRFHPPEEQFGAPLPLAYPAVDFDGDGIGDALLNFVRPPAPSLSRDTGSHTALARSGRDGHVIWKTVLDPREGWFEPGRGEAYGLMAFPMPEGDFDGDGTPDLVVDKQTRDSPGQVNRRAAALPLQLLSGRTGRLLWSAGPLPLAAAAQGYSQTRWFAARAVEPGGAPDLLVWHGNPFAKPASKFAAMRSPKLPSLARISGRDGRILWDVPVDRIPESENGTYAGRPLFDDLDGDGGLDTIFLLEPFPAAGRPDHELLALSLRDGRRLWSKPVKHQPNSQFQFLLGDLDGDKRPDVIDVAEVLEGNEFALVVRTFDGRDGRHHWTWNAGAVMRSADPSWTRSVLADLEGDGTRRICLNYKEKGGKRIFMILDGNGKEHARRELPGENHRFLRTADLDGDGRDEFLIDYSDQIHAWRHDLKELWSWPAPFGKIDTILPASRSRAGEVILYPGVALDGSTGKPRWVGQTPLSHSPPSFPPKLLDQGDATRPALLIAEGLGATICRVALPATREGTVAEPRGATAQPGLIRDDPRWTRPLPWVTWLAGPIGPWGFLAAGALAFFNVIPPLLIVRLAAGRQRFSIRALMALPVAATIPLMIFLMLEPVLPVGSGPLLASEKRLFIAGTLAGLPIVLYAGLVVWGLARWRWRFLAVLAAVTMLTSLIMAGVWLWFDMKSMPSIEHYGRTGWYLVLLPGAYAAGLFVLIGWAMRMVLRLIERRSFLRRTASMVVVAIDDG